MDDQGALSQIPQANGNNALGLLSMLSQRFQEAPSMTDLLKNRQTQLENLQNATLNADPMPQRSPLDLMAMGMAQHLGSNSSAPGFSQGVQNVVNYDDMRRLDDRQRQLASAQAGYNDASQLSNTLGTMGGANGLMGLARSGIVHAGDLIKPTVQLYKTQFKAYQEGGSDDPQRDAVNSLLQMGISMPDILKAAQQNSPLAQPMTGNAVQPATPSASQPDPKAATIAKLQQQMMEAVNDQDFATATDLQRQIASLSASNAWQPNQIAAGQKVVPQQAERVAVVNSELATAKQALADAQAKGDPAAIQQAQQDVDSLQNEMQATKVPNTLSGQSAVQFAGQKEQQKQFQKQFGEMGQEYTNQADSANKDLQNFQEMARVLNDYAKNGGDAGMLAPYKAKIQAFLQQTTGLSPDASEQLTDAQLAAKMNNVLATGAAKAINSSRATQFEFMNSTKNVPGIEMVPDASKEWLRYYAAQASLAKKQQGAFTTWRQSFGTQDPGAFSAYWGLYMDHPEAMQGITPAKIADLAQKHGVSANDVVASLRNKLGEQ